MRAARLTLVVSCFLFSACGTDEEPQPAPAAGGAAESAAELPSEAERATATVRDAAGRELGILTLSDDGDAILVSGSLQGLPPGTHAAHLHQVGSCEPPFASSGGHWNPTDRQHGMENPDGPHLGDMANLEVGTDGATVVQLRSGAGASLAGANPLMDADGAAVVVHANPDDHRNPVTGDRIACGVVTTS